MKKFFYILTSLICFTLVTPEVSGQPTASSYGGETKFRIIILGTRYRSDIDSIIQSLIKSPSTKRIVPMVISQDHLEYEGSYTGNEHSLISDIRGLAMNRFNMNESRGSGGEILITLRKIQPIATTPTPSPAKVIP